MKNMHALSISWLALATLLLAGCASDAPPRTATPGVVGPALIAPRYTTSPTPTDNIDSVTTWQAADGVTWLIASAKEADNLVIFDADSGANLRRVGRSGTASGEFRRPNGLTISGNLLFVVERDNHRAQVFSLPSFQHLLTLGEQEMRVPYGVWVQELPDGEREVYVTDSFQLPDGSPPPLPELNRRVHQFHLSAQGKGFKANFVRSFGETTPEGALRWVESIVGDPVHDRLMIAEEHLETGTAVRVYDSAGHYTGQDIGRELFKGQAEGIALFACADGSGYWFATDQDQGGNRFQIFDRESLKPLGSFASSSTQNTDGIHMRQQPSAAFPKGAFYAVHDDRAVSAFDWRDIAKALNLRTECTQGG